MTDKFVICGEVEKKRWRASIFAEQRCERFVRVRRVGLLCLETHQSLCYGYEHHSSGGMHLYPIFTSNGSVTK